MKHLVVCSDGTWNTPDRREGGEYAPTNVVKIARAVLPENASGDPQLVFYDAGVGTTNLLDRLLGGALGVGLSANVEEAYRSLLLNYVPGDAIYLFGFSRGAYTVRSLAGLIRKVGLLRKEHAAKAPAAFAIYRKRDATPDTEEAVAFRKAFSHHPVRIRFIGVWDTVGRLGIPSWGPFAFFSRGVAFHDVNLPRTVDFAYQALAIDERRGAWKPTVWSQNPRATDQVLEQAWFPGVHMDVGGGYRERGLSDGAFLWIQQKAQAAGLAFDPEYLDAREPNLHGTLHDSRNLPFSLLPPHARPIAQRDHSYEVVHGNARGRYLEDPTYRPPNLVDYYERHPQQAGER